MAVSGPIPGLSRRARAGRLWRIGRGRSIARLPTRVWLLLGIALILRIALVSATLYTPTTLDAADFSRNGLSIAQGHGIPPSNRAPGGGPSAYRPPAYPVFLAAVYVVAGQEAPPAARMVETVLGTVSVALIGLIATRLWGRRIGVMALGIAAIAPPLVVLSTTLVSEALFVPLVLGAVACALQARRSPHPLRWAVLTGVLAGVAELTRTNAVVIWPLLAYALWLAGPRRSWRGRLRPLVVVAVATLTVAPWTLRNWLVLHAFVPVSTEIGYTLAGTYNAASRAETHWPAVWKEAEHGASPEYGQILFTADIDHWNEVTYGDALQRQAITEIRQHPFYVLKVLAFNAIRMFHLGELDFAVDNLRDTDIPEVPAWLEILGFYPIGLLALAGLALGPVRRAPLWMWLVPVFLCSTLLVTGFIRFRSAVDPFLVMLAALGAIGIADAAKVHLSARWPGPRR
ncbi:MAG: glycosyltransferase family 39 protein [Solirubrobacterales bacterium]|nr:glycosyltransferase family 39 protein [Solirubrobacterales bacterium]